MADGFSTFNAPPPEGDDERIARLAKLPLLEYERVRQAEAETMGCRASILDRLVKRARPDDSDPGKQGRALAIATPEPWPDAVEGAVLLAELAAFFTRHLVLPAGAADALAVWTVHTYICGNARHTPRLAITSPEKGCGKTTVLDLLGMVTCKPLPTANISTAAVFRTIEMAAPTLLVDEADTFLADNEDLRGVLNAGHKRGGQVIRCVGDDAEPRQFNVYAPAAIAAIGRLPGTLADRSITITMRRAALKEKPEPIRSGTEHAGATLARKAARWAAEHGGGREGEPTIPEGLTNRAADNWRILFAIAEAAGQGWPARLAAASVALTQQDDGRDSLGILLLGDVRTLLAAEADGRLATAAIVALLVEMEDRPWPEVTQGKPLTATRFTRMVKPYGAAREQWREGAGGKDAPQVWGYTVASFADSFARYLPDTAVESGDTGDALESLGVGASRKW